MPAEDEIIVLADLVSGSPLTTTMAAISEKLGLQNVRAIGGMNLPMALTASMMKDALDGDSLAEALLQESRNGIQRMALDVGDEEEDV